VAVVMINGKREHILYTDNVELRRTLRLLKAYNTPSDPFHEGAKEGVAMGGSPLLGAGM